MMDVAVGGWKGTTAPDNNEEYAPSSRIRRLTTRPAEALRTAATTAFPPGTQPLAAAAAAAEEEEAPVLGRMIPRCPASPPAPLRWPSPLAPEDPSWYGAVAAAGRRRDTDKLRPPGSSPDMGLEGELLRTAAPPGRCPD